MLTDKFDNNKTLVGIIGHPIRHSYSPFMHNTSFKMRELDYIYLPFDILASNLEDALKGMVALGIKGFNVTLPYKEKIMDFLSDISEEAVVIGAVNTIVNESGKLMGFNTDVDGIHSVLEPYKEKLENSTISVIGAGGAARSVIYSLIRNFKPRKINIINRTEEKAESLKEYFSAKMLFEKIEAFELIPPDIVELLNTSALIVNATSIGMLPDEDDAPTTIADSFRKDQLVFDLIYNPIDTKFLKLAKSQGAVTINGLKMFVRQGAKSFELWTGEQIIEEEIYKLLQEKLPK